MKRFWKEARAVERGDGWGVELDGKPLRTPGKKGLTVPSVALAEAIAAEWSGAAEKLATYGESDLLCYRAEAPAPLIAREAAAWGPLLAWARRRFDVDFVVTSGITHVPQPAATVARLGHAVAMLDAFRLAALSPLVTIGGSLVAALAVLEEAIAPEEAWQAVSVDEYWQLEQWGADAEAEAALANKQRDFLAAADLLRRLD